LFEVVGRNPEAYRKQGELKVYIVTLEAGDGGCFILIDFPSKVA
jgi:hypothetical protein